MLQVPKDQKIAFEVLDSLARLSMGNRDFKVVLSWLDFENDRIAKLNRKEIEDVPNRWKQGAGQLLDKLFKIIKTSHEESIKLEQQIKYPEV